MPLAAALHRGRHTVARRRNRSSVAAVAVLVALTGLLLATGAARAQSVSQAIYPVGDARPRLVRSQTDVFIVQGRLRRWVVSLQVFADYRYRDEWVERITDEEMGAIARGPDLVAGPILRAIDGELWVVLDGQRRRLAGPDAFVSLNLSAADAVSVDAATLAAYPIGRPIGNPPRPWLAAVPAVLLAAAGAVWWRGGSWPSAIAITLAGAALKLLYVTQYPWVPDGADAAGYVTTARYLAAGGSLFDDGPFDGLRLLTAPLYSVLLAGLSPLVGGSVVGWKMVQVVAALALVPLVADLTTRLYGRRAGVAAALCAALSPLWFYSAELLQYELWLGWFILVGFWCLVRACYATERVAAWVALSGLGFGLACVLQLKSIVLLLPVGVFVLWWQTPQPVSAGARRPTAFRADSWRWPARRAAVRPIVTCFVFGTLALVPLGLWGWRNQAVHGEPLLGSHATGINFWIGNHPAATGGIMAAPRPDAFYERLSRYPEALVSRESRAFRDLAWDFIQSHPSQVALLALTKLERFWWTIEPDRLGEFVGDRTQAFLGGWFDRTAVRIGSKLVHVVVLLFAVAGTLAGWGLRRDAPQGPDRHVVRGLQWLLLSSLACFWLVHAAFIAEPRYRLPVSPLLQVLQGAGLAVFREPFRSKEDVVKQ